MFAFLVFILFATEVAGIRMQQESHENLSDEDDLAQRQSCLEEARTNDDPCVKITYENGCVYEIDVTCYGEKACRRHIAAMDDPCIKFASYDPEAPACKYSRSTFCERAFGTFESIANGVKAIFKTE